MSDSIWLAAKDPNTSFPKGALRIEPVIDVHRSLVELRCRLKMYSRRADIAYRTERPILINRGPLPFRRDLANQECDTPRSLATCAGCSRESILRIRSINMLLV